MAPEYRVRRIKHVSSIDADWNKPMWERANILTIDHQMGEAPRHRPVTEARLLYDESNLYVIFRVHDRYVKSEIKEINGPVSEDSCVEFFFAPDPAFPLYYFNLEINAGGTPLMSYVTEPRKVFTRFEPHEFGDLEIAHSLPAHTEKEISSPLTWTVEYRLPFSMLRPYSQFPAPKEGARWAANFFKIASETSDPHYFTWSKVDRPQPDFHVPEAFGTIIFE